MPLHLSEKVSDEMLFKNNDWIKKMKENEKMRPGLVGIDKGWYYALIIVAEDPMEKSSEKLFFDSLHDDWKFNDIGEIIFERSPITLNISALRQPEAIELKDLTKLFNTSGGIQTTVRYFGEKKVYKFNGKKIIGWCHGPCRTLDNVKKAFELDLELEKGRVVPQSFSVPKCPRLFRIGNCLISVEEVSGLLRDNPASAGP